MLSGRGYTSYAGRWLTARIEARVDAPGNFGDEPKENRNARRFAANMRPIIDEIVRAGATSHNAIAAKLNERNVRTARGGVWTHVQVGAILHPFGGASGAHA
jgi:hypothetical protein